MSNLTTTISVQIDKNDKEKATIILDKLGVSMSGLINMTIKQLIMRGKIPFDVSLPKEENELYNYFTKEELNNTYKELENDMKNNLKSPYYIRFNSGVGEIGNFTIYDARSYYCIEIYIDGNEEYQIRGIRYVDVYKDHATGKMVLIKPLPDDCKHYMYLFKNEYVKAYKKGKLRNNGFGAYRGVENINENTGKMRLYSNCNLTGRDTKINLAGECKKIEMSILGHVIGERKCGDQSLFTTEKG